MILFKWLIYLVLQLKATSHTRGTFTHFIWKKKSFNSGRVWSDLVIYCCCMFDYLFKFLKLSQILKCFFFVFNKKKLSFDLESKLRVRLVKLQEKRNSDTFFSINNTFDCNSYYWLQRWLNFIWHRTRSVFFLHTIVLFFPLFFLTNVYIKSQTSYLLNVLKSISLIKHFHFVNMR